MDWFDKKTIGLFYVCIFVICFLSFNTSWHYFPYLKFYDDTSIIICSLVIFLIAFSQSHLLTKIPKVTVFLIILAVVWLLQIFFLDIVYIENSLKAALFFMVLALLTWGVSGFLSFGNTDKFLKVFAWLLLLGSIVQATTYLLQLYVDPEKIDWIIKTNRGNGWGGQLGQRNLFAHYLMWGALSGIYLLTDRKVNLIKNLILVVMILFIIGILGISASRSILLYLMAFFCLVVIAWINSKRLGAIPVFAKYIAFFSFLVFLSQWLMPKLIKMLMLPNQIQSGLNRVLENSGDIYRLIEWKKALQMFLNDPLYGVGYGNYAYQSFLLDETFFSTHDIQRSGFFSHSHNSILQVMAEMGIVGTTLILFGLATILLRPLLSLSNDKAIYLIGLISVTLLHSMVEYPLWNANFLAVFFIILTILPFVCNQDGFLKLKFLNSCWLRNSLSIFTGLMMFMALGALFLNQYHINRLVAKSNQQSVDLHDIRRQAMFDLSESIPLMREYADLRVFIDTPVNKQQITQEEFNAISRVAHLQPVSQSLNAYGMLLYREGRREEALELLKKTWKKYPMDIPKVLSYTYKNKSMFGDLIPQLYEMCIYYKDLNIYSNYTQNSCDIKNQ